ncbi:Biopterin-dependent aromatic amino acid hydroxylase-domain-containing protein [Fimicolochytrium jonesii]|uniref:Biopterin-dependent aromatic amino acid hydroxylase-domain-containing protein n=1 Tax=Fimicolochytrium jonesii TaxID=1396493 RepID=UPI0022FE2CC4|nr:Biopterin-dependent aromatic amino acid hydroxylase-domain-containing protein [Fimicolochytrium jonesii]KAI8823529.1 Biopterin-dependent aromatic amino acid hydroxylase-domain-containing protein [Fimicolochytrium jonesii]
MSHAAACLAGRSLRRAVSQLRQQTRTLSTCRAASPWTASFRFGSYPTALCAFPASARPIGLRFHGNQATATAAAPVETGNPMLRVTLSFKIEDRAGALEEVLRQLSKLNVSLSRIESRPSQTRDFYEIFVDFNAGEEAQIERVSTQLQKVVKELRVVSSGDTDRVTLQKTPWFPRKKSDMDTFAEKVMSYGQELDADHPGFKDPVYRERRAEITRIARTYKYGEAVPRIQYTEQETKTWGIVYKKLTALYKTHACREHQYVLPLLEHNCGYAPDNIPQVEDVSRFMKESTGWTLRPVMGLLSSRDFLNALAFRVFHSTQYIRHHSEPLYTPEPDLCHELLGHVPLYADPDFADFSQEIGLASLGASDEAIEKLATIYWFTVEFGLCRQGNEIKAYGAGLLSSFGELEYCLSDKPKKVPFDPKVAAVQKYPITEYQPLYFVAESFKDMKEQVRDYATDSIDRPFVPRYNALTESIEVLDTKDKTVRHAQNIKGELTRLISAVEKLHL